MKKQEKVYVVLHADGQDYENGYEHSSVKSIFKTKSEAEHFVLKKSSDNYWIKEVIIGEEYR